MGVSLSTPEPPSYSRPERVGSMRSSPTAVPGRAGPPPQSCNGTARSLERSAGDVYGRAQPRTQESAAERATRTLGRYSPVERVSALERMPALERMSAVERVPAVEPPPFIDQLPDQEKYRDFQGGPVPTLEPPMFPAANAVYNLMDDDDEAETCPTCLEEYTDDNPMITAACGHSFHLSCILEWANRSHTCPFFCAGELQCPGLDVHN